MDVIVFRVGINHYALNIENIQRIVQAVELTSVPGSHRLIDGMMNYEKNVVKVFNFRKLIELPIYEEELQKDFIAIKNGHEAYVADLENSVFHDAAFLRSTSPYTCSLGKWLATFNSHDDDISKLLKHLVLHHRNFHNISANILEIHKNNKEEAIALYKKEIKNAITTVLGDINTLIQERKTVANSLQKLVIYENNGSQFAIKVDAIEDIVNVNEKKIIYSSDNIGETELLGILDIKGVLVNIIKSVKLPTKGDKYGN